MKDLNESLYPIEREDANLEAERNETAVMPVNQDGLPGLFKIQGKPHSKGGTPLNLPDNSFIFSQYDKMKVRDEEVQDMFGLKPKKSGYTYAEISERYDLNKYLKILMDPDSTKLEKKTANLMIQNNMMKLGKLALIQEASKGFEENVIPVISMPYMQKMGIMPDQFFKDDNAPQQNQMDPISMSEDQMPEEPMFLRGGSKKRKVKIVGLPKAQEGKTATTVKKKSGITAKELKSYNDKNKDNSISYYDNEDDAIKAIISSYKEDQHVPKYFAIKQSDGTYTLKSVKGLEEKIKQIYSNYSNNINYKNFSDALTDRLTNHYDEFEKIKELAIQKHSIYINKLDEEIKNATNQNEKDRLKKAKKIAEEGLKELNNITADQYIKFVKQRNIQLNANDSYKDFDDENKNQVGVSPSGKNTKNSSTSIEESYNKLNLNGAQMSAMQSIDNGIDWYSEEDPRYNLYASELTDSKSYSNGTMKYGTRRDIVSAPDGAAGQRTWQQIPTYINIDTEDYDQDLDFESEELQVPDTGELKQYNTDAPYGFTMGDKMKMKASEMYNPTKDKVKRPYYPTPSFDRYLYDYEGDAQRDAATAAATYNAVAQNADTSYNYALANSLYVNSRKALADIQENEMKNNINEVNTALERYNTLKTSYDKNIADESTTFVDKANAASNLIEAKKDAKRARRADVYASAFLNASQIYNDNFSGEHPDVYTNPLTLQNYLVPNYTPQITSKSKTNSQGLAEAAKELVEQSQVNGFNLDYKDALTIMQNYIANMNSNATKQNIATQKMQSLNN